MDTETLRAECKKLTERTVASLTGLPTSFLGQIWQGPYAPEKHLFKRIDQGQWESKWVLDPDTMKKITQGYLLWHAIPEGMKAQFWKTMFELYLQCPEFEAASTVFRVWIFFQRFPTPLYNLQAILREIGPCESHKGRGAPVTRDTRNSKSPQTRAHATASRIWDTLSSLDTKNTPAPRRPGNIQHVCRPTRHSHRFGNDQRGMWS